jgi:hypothetical protein
MDIIKYLERVTVIFNPDGTVRGSEAHEHTGYLEERVVADAPGGTQQVFVVVKPEVRTVEAGDLAGALDHGCAAVEDAAAKANVILDLQQTIEQIGAELVAAEQTAAARAETIESQAALITQRDGELAEAAKRETELRQEIQRLAGENSALTAEPQAARTAAVAAA